MEEFINFDWAMKRLLRNKANHEVLEGLMESLLEKPFRIKAFLESESNQEDSNDKFNRVDILAEDLDGALYIFEIQNSRELSYFHRMLYGVSKSITEYIKKGEKYDKVRKVYSINIVYFELGQGKDYVYRGCTRFQGLHDKNDYLQLSEKQKKQFLGIEDKEELSQPKDASAIFPEYYVLRVNEFNTLSKTPLDEWISFLKTGEIKDSFSAPGLDKARECLRYDSLDKESKRAYQRHLENLMYQKSVIETGIIDGREEGFAIGREEGRIEGKKEGRLEGRLEGIADGKKEQAMEDAKGMIALGIEPKTIALITKLSEEEVKILLENFS